MSLILDDGNSHGGNTHIYKQASQSVASWWEASNIYRNVQAHAQLFATVTNTHIQFMLVFRTPFAIPQHEVLFTAVRSIIIRSTQYNYYRQLRSIIYFTLVRSIIYPQ